MIPDPYDPLSWDRYSYVRNNALRYTDPSGHYLCEGTGKCKPNNEHPVHPAKNTKLTPPKGLTKGKADGSNYGGEQVWHLYTLAHQTQGGWWWRKFGGDGIFDLFDFAALLLYYEATYYQSETFHESAIRAYWGWCNHLGYDGNLTGNLLNWLAAITAGKNIYKQIINVGISVEEAFYRIYERYPNSTTPIDTGPALDLANHFKNPPTNWKGVRWGSPQHWGNLSLYELDRETNEYILSQSDKLWYVAEAVPLENTFIIPSTCVLTSINKGVYNFSVCPSVR